MQPCGRRIEAQSSFRGGALQLHYEQTGGPNEPLALGGPVDRENNVSAPLLFKFLSQMLSQQRQGWAGRIRGCSLECRFPRLATFGTHKAHHLPKERRKETVLGTTGSTRISSCSPNVRSCFSNILLRRSVLECDKAKQCTRRGPATTRTACRKVANGMGCVECSRRLA